MILIFMVLLLLSVLMPFFVDLYVQNHPEKFHTYYKVFEYKWVEEENLLHCSDKYLHKKLPQKYIDKWYNPTIRYGTLLNLGIGLTLGIVLWITYKWELLFMLIPWILGNIIWLSRVSLGEEMYGTNDEMLEIFTDEIKELEYKNGEETKLCEAWREKHPLEEMCRKALTGNPNYVADLIREIYPDILSS